MQDKIWSRNISKIPQDIRFPFKIRCFDYQAYICRIAKFLCRLRPVRVRTFSCFVGNSQRSRMSYQYHDILNEESARMDQFTPCVCISCSFYFSLLCHESIFCQIFLLSLNLMFLPFPDVFIHCVSVRFEYTSNPSVLIQGLHCLLFLYLNSCLAFSLKSCTQQNDAMTNVLLGAYKMFYNFACGVYSLNGLIR